MKPKIIQHGAEAVIILDNSQILKHRIKKSYRHPELDKRLRKSRTKSEAKIIAKLHSILPVPKIIKTDDKESILMEFIPGLKLSENLESLDYKKISRQIGENITRLHNQDIIHGDLTTSNIIYIENLKESIPNNEVLSSPHNLSIDDNFKIFLIDFGLSFHSKKIEDKAVDLHLLNQALNAKHFDIADEAFKIILEHYLPFQREEILNQLKKVESRGRYKDKY